ncbi:MAG: LysM peptidoglycan-binding domain-containing protein [Gammaproteobacteria bacterium]|nr:LysM peptidoglycan-binding domain-containing protein [Gammaproteobacteria bacterium]
MFFKKSLASLLFVLVAGVTLAADVTPRAGAAKSGDEIVLHPNYPARYVVRTGDTLWEIASRFLRDPWRWPDVWDFENKIENPQYIYPGDVVVLVKTNGKPMLKVQRSEAKAATTRLTPRIRATKLDRAIPTLPIDAIKQFVSQPRVLTERDLQSSGYVVASSGDHLIGGTGDQIYARGLPAGKNNSFAIYRTGKSYQNTGGKSDELLGYEAIYIGTAMVKTFGDPSTLQIVDANRETLIGDRLLPMARPESDSQWVPRAPEAPVEGRIIDVVDAVARVGQFQTVVLNLGELDGLQRGHVLAVYRAGSDARDVVSSDSRDSVQLPDTRAGLAMVFRTFDRVSYALIMKAEQDIRLYDAVRKP